MPPPVSTATPPVHYELEVGELGTAKGVVLKSFKQRDFYGFMSLPFAKPPEGELRFKYPAPWEGPWENNYYDASYLRARCAQGSLVFTGIISGREDCLHLSVYTPLLPEHLGEDQQKGLPVMVFIHGGAYMSGDSYLYVPTKLMDRDVLVVTVQYRLGLFGFLAGGIVDAPGNMGLMDQVEALRWVQKHIHHFGGNPDLVTVFGQSAGGASSSWMHLTPLTQASAEPNNNRQLLHRVIPQSGSALEEWTLDNTPETSFLNTASVMMCNNTSFTKEDMVACMREATYVEVAKAGIKIYADDRYAGGLGFRGLCPVVQEGMEDLDIELVIPKQPRDILDNAEFAKIPVMFGSLRDEGSLIMGLTYKDYMLPNGHNESDYDFMRYEALPLLLEAFGIDDKTASVSRSMQMTYLPDAEMGDWDSMIGGMIDLSGVMFLKSGLWELTRRASLAAPEYPFYFYSWEYEADDSLFDWIFMSVPDIPMPGGVSHADELLYLFHLPSDHDDRQKIMVDRMTKIWTNFAIHGNPTPDEAMDELEGGVEKWLPYDPVMPYFMLVQDNFTMAVDYSTRWNYHLNSTTDTSTTTMMPDMVSRDAYEEMKESRTDYQIATGLLGILLGCALILFVIIYVRKRRKTNAIV